MGDVVAVAGVGTPHGLLARSQGVTGSSPRRPLLSSFGRLKATTNARTDLNTKVLHNLTYALILHPIAGGLGFLAFLFGLIGVGVASRGATIVMSLLAFLGAVAGLVVFVIDMVLWNVLKNRLTDNNYDAKLVSCSSPHTLTLQGIANWFTVGGTAALLLATCTAMCGACGRFATGRSAGEKACL